MPREARFVFESVSVTSSTDAGSFASDTAQSCCDEEHGDDFRQDGDVDIRESVTGVTYGNELSRRVDLRSLVPVKLHR